MKKSGGFSIIEILVVLVVLGIIGVITTNAIITTIRGTKRSDSDSLVRQSVAYSLSVIERQVRSAKTVSCVTAQRLNYTDSSSNNGSFFLTTGRIASGSASVIITSPDVTITSVTFTCVDGAGASPDSVEITITAEDSTQTGIEKSTITASTQITLRSL